MPNETAGPYRVVEGSLGFHVEGRDGRVLMFTPPRRMNEAEEVRDELIAAHTAARRECADELEAARLASNPAAAHVEPAPWLRDLLALWRQG